MWVNPIQSHIVGDKDHWSSSWLFNSSHNPKLIKNGWSNSLTLVFRSWKIFKLLLCFFILVSLNLLKHWLLHLGEVWETI
jgi:hypothetical protein